MILCIETATNICSVSLCHNNNILANRNSDEDKSHASRLTVFIKEILTQCDITTDELDAIAISKGPGSYTGLRIGTSTAKGISFASSLPLIAVDTPFAMFHGAKALGQFDYYCPMIDARRMEVYTAMYNHKGDTVKQISAEVVHEKLFEDILSKGRTLFFGNGAEKCREIIKHKNAVFSDSFCLSADFLCTPASIAFNNKQFEDTAYFEPFYLKDFIAIKSKKNILGNT